jgi:hypothetical protein
MQEVIKVAVEDYATKLYLEHLLKYRMYRYITAEQARLKAFFAAEEAPNEAEYQRLQAEQEANELAKQSAREQLREHCAAEAALGKKLLARAKAIVEDECTVTRTAPGQLE